ncbi:ATP-grasp domain-containing protein [Candidatus Woesearchaeota archaeon]|nr:ATP-grasp domain-containing protein [Candidatus Woesearchaeota archaeon]
MSDDSSAPAASGEFEGKTILFVNSGSKKKEFTLATAKRLGLKVVLLNKTCTWQRKYVDSFIPADTYVHNEVITKLTEFLKKNRIDGAVTFWEDDVPLLAKLCAEFGWIGPSVETAEKARSKFSMRDSFVKGNVPCPRYYLINPNGNGGEAALKAAIEAVGLPAVIKPCWGSDSEFVVKVSTEEEAKEAYSYVLKNAVPKFNPIFKYNNSQFVFEEYMDGPEVNVESLTQNSETHVISVSDKMPMEEPYFMERGDYMPTRFGGEMLGRIKEVVRVAHRAIGAQNCVSHTEVKITPEGPKVVEIAVRMGGDYLWDWVKTVWSVDLVEQGIRIALGLPLDYQRAAQPNCYLTGKYFIPEESGVISTIRITPGIEKLPYVKTLKLNKHVGDPVLVPPLGFENMGWIVAKGENHIESERDLNSVFDNVKITVLKFGPSSSIGKTIRKSPLWPAGFKRSEIIRGAKIEKIRLISNEQIPRLHVGVLCNMYETKLGDTGVVEKDLMTIGKHIQEALESKGHTVTFFDMNEYPLPFKKIMESGIDIMFNVCERINDSSLLEPHAAALLDMLGIPYTGSNPQTLSLCIDKIRMKKLLQFHDIPTAKWDYIYDMNDELDDELRFPLIVKPANADNSIGITNESVVTNKDELYRQLKKVVVDESRPALVEEYIEGDEYDVSILGNEDDVVVLPLSRSMFEDMPPGFWHIYPFDAKWGGKGGEPTAYDKIKVERPAKIPKKMASLITEIALDTYNILDAHDYGRVEIRVDKDGNPYVIELNPNPSIDVGDCVPACAEVFGMSYADFIEKILWYAIKRYQGRAPYYHLRTSTNI